MRDVRVPAAVSRQHHDLLIDLARTREAEHGSDLLGLVLSGSVGRGLATDRSDLDVYVVLTDAGLRDHAVAQPAALVDEVPVGLADLESPPPFGTRGWWFRWSFAWAPVLLDRTEARLEEALLRQATVTPGEATSILVEHTRLDGWLNYAYRALKSDRAGRRVERRLDAAESVPWLLDVIFTLAGRVRPYHSYLPWELREHPLPDWDADDLLRLLDATLDGDPTAIRTTFARVEALCTAFDPALAAVIEGWGDQLSLLRP